MHIFAFIQAADRILAKASQSHKERVAVSRKEMNILDIDVLLT